MSLAVMLLLVALLADALQVAIAVGLGPLLCLGVVPHEAIKVVHLIGLSYDSPRETDLTEWLILELECSQSAPPCGVVYRHALLALRVVLRCPPLKPALNCRHIACCICYVSSDPYGWRYTLR